MEGVVNGVRFNKGEREYLLTDGKEEYRILSTELLAPGMCLGLEGEAAPNLRIIPKSIEIISDQREQKIYERVKSNAKATAKISSAPVLVSDEVIGRLWPALREAALELLCAKKLGREVLLRFHGDADGICGAFALTSIINCKTYQQNSAVYTVRDALKDVAAIGQENRPLIVLLDFGSGDACLEGLDLLRAGGIQVIVVDHHPLASTGGHFVVNPLKVSENASKYTAGYLACEIAVACGLELKRGMELARVACSGDKSDILETGTDEAEKALVLDFLAAHASFGNNLEFYRNVMAKQELFSSIAHQAKESIDDAAKKASATMKTTKTGGLEIVTLPLERIVTKGEWPPSGKITTRVYEMVAENVREKPVLCIGYNDRSLIIRINDAATTLGLNANDLAERIKKSMADFVEGGGGHAKAGAIRVKSGFVKEVLGELIREATTVSLGNKRGER